MPFFAPASLSHLFGLVSELNRIKKTAFERKSIKSNELSAYEYAVNSLLKHTTGIFGILEDLKQDECVRERREEKGFEGQKVDERLLELLVNVREKARKAKHYDISDYIREELGKLGVILEDTPAGTKWKLQR